MVIEVNDNNFRKEVLDESKNKIVIVDFWAGWCMPCKIMNPIFESVEKNYPKIKFVKINIDKNPKISLKYDINNVPLIQIFENEAISKEFVGFKPKDDLEKWINSNIKK